jgi:hypothetical protein
MRSNGSILIVNVFGQIQAEDHFAIIPDSIRSVDPQVPLFDVKTLEQPRLKEPRVRAEATRTRRIIWGTMAKNCVRAPPFNRSRSGAAAET